MSSYRCGPPDIVLCGSFRFSWRVELSLFRYSECTDIDCRECNAEIAANSHAKPINYQSFLYHNFFDTEVHPYGNLCGLHGTTMYRGF